MNRLNCQDSELGFIPNLRLNLNLSLRLSAFFQFFKNIVCILSAEPTRK